MFDIFCTACERRQLVFPDQVLGIGNDADGIHMVFRCRCESVGVWHTGRSARQVASARAA